MKRLRSLLLYSLPLCVLIQPANSCGPFFDEAVFTTSRIPEAREEKYFAGHLGVIQNTYYPRYLMAAYLWLSGRGLSKQEQQAIVPDQPPADQTPESKAENAASAARWPAAIAATRHIPGSQWETFDNCLMDAFATAQRTLTDRVNKYGATNPDVLDWQAGQAAVFSNCGDGSMTLPAPAPVKASLWLKQDRAYQTASAQFYATDFPSARKAFEEVGADTSSPWHQLARLLAVRAMVRQATLTPTDAPPEKQVDRALMLEAEKRLRQLIADPEMKPLLTALRSYDGYVALRATPAARAVELASQIDGPSPDPTFGQDMTDLLYYFSSPGAFSDSDLQARSEMVDWVQTMRVPDPEHALKKWRATHSDAWLIAALTLQAPGAADAGTGAELAAAALKIPANSPAYASATYHRLRLMPVSAPSGLAAQRAELTRLLPAIEKTETQSTINLFLTLRAATAPTLDDFLLDAARMPAATTSNDEEDPDAMTVAGGKMTVCAVELTSAKAKAEAARRFDQDGAVILNQRLPADQMAAAGTSEKLPQPLRFETALAAWSRAVLLDQPQIAASLSPGLAACQPGMKQWLDKYDHSTSSDDRHANGLMALMRFPSIRPYVNLGVSRNEDFAAYDDYRDNWWCADLGTDTQSNNFVKNINYPGKPATVLKLVPTDRFPNPPFVDAASAGRAAGELEALGKIGSAPDYFAAQSLGWVAAHPADERNADLLGFAKRVMRNGCRTEQSSEWDHKLFLALQKKYPNSSWAKKYTTWE